MMYTALRAIILASVLLLPQTLKSQGRIWYVNQNHPQASDSNNGTDKAPFRTMNHAAQLANPCDTVLVFEGVYRERICPAHGGEAGKPIVYLAAPGQKVFLRGSDVFSPKWNPFGKIKGLYHGAFKPDMFGYNAYAGNVDTALFGNCNPFLVGFYRSEISRPQTRVIHSIQNEIVSLELELKTTGLEDDRLRRQKRKLESLQREYAALSDSVNTFYRLTLGMVFLEGVPLVEVQYLSDLEKNGGTWMVAPDGEGLYIHFPDGTSPSNSLVEITTRHTVFAPLQRNLGYIHVKGFVIEHAANHYPAWGPHNWSQVGALSCRSGHHWTIENNTVRYSRGIGIDCGSEYEKDEKIEFPGSLQALPSKIKIAYEAGEITDQSSLPGHHIIRNNIISDNGICGITGIGQAYTIITGNVIERNNRYGNTSPLWEFGGIKFHYFFHGLIEGNIIRDNDAHGIWLDNQWKDTRVSRNVVLNNLWSGMNIELARGPLLIDNNIVAYTRQGSGLYGHDVSQVTMVHNLIYANANYGVWFAYATPRVKPENACWDHTIVNNLILGNSAGAISLPLPWELGGRNVSDGNVFMGGGEYLDEGSGPLPVTFQLNNFSHMGKMTLGMPDGVLPMTPARLYTTMISELNRKKLSSGLWPDSLSFIRHCEISLDIWRILLDNDKNSVEISVIKDGLQSKIPSWEFDVPQQLFHAKCSKVHGVDFDFTGQKIDEENVVPGPFQNLKTGRNRIVLLPDGFSSPASGQ